MSENNQEVNHISRLDQITAAVEKRKREIGIAFGFLLIVGSGLAGYTWLENKKELSANQDYFMLQYQNNLQQDPKGLANEDVQTQYRAFIQDNAAYTAGKKASIELANFFDQEKQFDKAVEILNMVKNDSLDKIVDVLFDYRKAIALQKNNQCDLAIPIYDRIGALRTHKYLNAPSLLQKGLCYEKMGQTDKAIETYENLSSTYSDTESGQKAKKYLILLKLGA